MEQAIEQVWNATALRACVPITWRISQLIFTKKSLVGRKTSEEINEERTRAFEQKYTKKVEQDYERTLAVLPKEMKEEKERAIERTYEELSRRLSIHTAEDFQFDDRQKAVLKLKLARHFQQNNSLLTKTLFLTQSLKRRNSLIPTKGRFIVF